MDATGEADVGFMNGIGQVLTHGADAAGAKQAAVGGVQTDLNGSIMVTAPRFADEAAGFSLIKVIIFPAGIIIVMDGCQIFHRHVVFRAAYANLQVAMQAAGPGCVHAEMGRQGAAHALRGHFRLAYGAVGIKRDRLQASFAHG